jgi:hypothetical protein
MRLIRATTAIRRFFDPEDAPDYRTVIAAIRRGDIPGQIWENGDRVQAWVDAEAFEARTGNALADEILADLAKRPRRAITQQ